MRHFGIVLKSLLLISIVIGTTVYASAADEANTEVTGYYQQYRDFSYKTGATGYEISPTSLKGGGFSIAHNLAPWFAMWTQLSFYGSAEQPLSLYGSAEQPSVFSARIIHNLEGIRYQTKQYGPLRLYAKAGMGFANYSLKFSGTSSGGETKFSAAYGVGAHVWMSDNFGINLDASNVVMGVPKLTDSNDRDKWDSGLVLTTGLTIRF
jgi:hypothetical protein